MNLRLLVVTLAAPASLLAGEPGGAQPSVAQKSLVLLTQTFPYQPAVRQEAEAKLESASPVLKMERVTVLESFVPRGLVEKMESERQQLRDEKFTLTKGGAIGKLGPFKVGVWPDKPGTFGIFKMKW